MFPPLLSLALASSAQFTGLPHFTYVPAVLAGQREIALGPMLLQDTVMEVRFDTDVPAQIGEGRIPPPTWKEYAKGYVRWSVKDGLLFEKSCRILSMDCTTKGENITKTKRIGYACQNITTWWITPDGKLLRQAVTLNDPIGKRHAEAVYWPDHIEVSVVDSKNNRQFTLYPNIDMTLLDAQFKPMIDGEKILNASKEYYVFDPFTQAFTKYKATVRGIFHGTWLATRFEGLHIDITGPKFSETAFISKENDLVKVDMPDNTAIVLDYLPPARDPAYNVIKKHG